MEALRWQHVLYCEKQDSGWTPTTPQQCLAFHQIHRARKRKHSTFLGHSPQVQAGWHLQCHCQQETYIHWLLPTLQYHPTNMKCGLVRCLYYHTWSITLDQRKLDLDKRHLAKMLYVEQYFRACIIAGIWRGEESQLLLPHKPLFGSWIRTGWYESGPWDRDDSWNTCIVSGIMNIACVVLTCS